MNVEPLQQTISNDIQVISMSSLFKIVREKGFACAFYRLPGKENSDIIIDVEGSHPIKQVKLEQCEEGFIFHPFSRDSHEIKFLKNDIHFTSDSSDNTLKIMNSVLSTDEIWEYLDASVVNEKVLNHSERAHLNLDKNESDEKSNFIEYINNAIDSIKEGKFQKVVTARKKTIHLKNDFDPVGLFKNLCNAYKNSFVYLTYIPEVGIWCGATPELLIEKSRGHIFKTIALAATQEKIPEIELSDVSWTQKDIEEQAMVSRYIINCFKKIRLREFEEIGPRSHHIGNLIHLKTDFIVDMNQVEYPELCSTMLELLHPTSAVCGMPKDDALGFILDHEGFEREYFTGYLGPVNIYDESHLFVNLRCMKLTNSHADLFAGAGILSNSNPEKEWHETEIKMDTILNVLNQL